MRTTGLPVSKLRKMMPQVRLLKLLLRHENFDSLPDETAMETGHWVKIPLFSKIWVTFQNIRSIIQQLTTVDKFETDINEDSEDPRIIAYCYLF